MEKLPQRFRPSFRARTPRTLDAETVHDPRDELPIPAAAHQHQHFPTRAKFFIKVRHHQDPVVPESPDPGRVRLAEQKPLRILQAVAEAAPEQPDQRGDQRRAFFRQEPFARPDHANGLRFHQRVIDRQGVSNTSSRISSSVDAARASWTLPSRIRAGIMIRAMVA